MTKKTNSKTETVGNAAADAADTPKVGMAAHLRKYRAKYTKTHGYNQQGSLDNNDQIAKLLRPLSPDQVVALAEKVLKHPAGSLKQRYENLNPGQRRMNSGNLMRNATKRGELTPAAVKKALGSK